MLSKVSHDEALSKTPTEKQSVPADQLVARWLGTILSKIELIYSGMQSDNKKPMVHTHKRSAVEIIFPLLFFLWTNCISALTGDILSRFHLCTKILQNLKQILNSSDFFVLFIL